MDQIIDQAAAIKGMKGFYKIWNVDPVTGKSYLLRDRPNMILNQGADLLAKALAGVQYTAISHMYIGYCNTDTTVVAPTIDEAYSIPFTAYGSGSYANFGYLRIPLAYSPSFIAQSGYSSNVALFTTIVATSAASNGAPFYSSLENDGAPSQIFEVGLVAATNPTNASQDVVFSRANFAQLEYNANYNLTTTWGIQFLA